MLQFPTKGRCSFCEGNSGTWVDSSSTLEEYASRLQVPFNNFLLLMLGSQTKMQSCSGFPFGVYICSVMPNLGSPLQISNRSYCLAAFPMTPQTMNIDSASCGLGHSIRPSSMVCFLVLCGDFSLSFWPCIPCIPMYPPARASMPT